MGRSRPVGAMRLRGSSHGRPGHDGGPSVPPPDGDETTTRSTAQLTGALRTVGSIIAPITLITALMFYFGVQHAHWYFQYFGVNHTVMGLTTQDYLLRSADGLFVPVVSVAVLALLSLWLYRLLTGRVPAERKPMVQRRIAAVATMLGVIALTVAVIGIARPETFVQASAAPGLSLALGALLLALASNLQWQARTGGETKLPGWVGATEWGALFIVVGIGLFWSVTNYSSAVGETRAYRTAVNLSAEPEAVLYSKERLSVPGVAARELVCVWPEEAGGAYGFRYEGLKLVFATDTAYFFLPSDWPAGGGVAIVLPRSDPVRVEFVRPDLEQGASC